LREEDKINVVMDVCLGLLFLAQENILHRDLKEFNIMVDSQKRGRLIDFGSVSNVYTKNNFKAKDNKRTYLLMKCVRRKVTICRTVWC
jgi:serine/threonine protein kinase